MSGALFDTSDSPPVADVPAYRVLARKYRPQNFSELKGQDALVRTLTNAFASGRIAHAFILTGVRGVGKTTTARIIAKGLNCEKGPTVTPCGICPSCVSIAEGRNMDVIEMNAADNRKIEDVRAIIDGARYAPTSVRTKIYILDEVHMFVSEAFNALLKILEEPPPHVKFILATTEIRKVPVTILSRCQRFDLRRVEPEVLAAHFAGIAQAEGIAVEKEALQLLARAADGSVRDGLSLLDQAIARSGEQITAEILRDMLGLADRGAIFDLLEHALTGQPVRALEQLATLHRDGVDAAVVLQDLLDATHQLARLKVLPPENLSAAVTASEHTRLTELAARFTTPVLARAWQVLLKGLPEIQGAPQPMGALEMLLIRLSHMGNLPPPGELVRKLEGVLASTGAGSGGTAATTAPAAPLARRVAGAGMAALSPSPQPSPQPAALPAPENWRQAVALFAEKKEMQLYAQLYSSVECLAFAPGRIDLFPRPGTPPALVQRVAAHLQDWTGQRWLVNTAREPGRVTLAEEDEARQENTLRVAAEHPLVRAVLLAFPGSRIEAVRDTALPDPPDTSDDMTDGTNQSDEE